MKIPFLSCILLSILLLSTLAHSHSKSQEQTVDHQHKTDSHANEKHDHHHHSHDSDHDHDHDHDHSDEHERKSPIDEFLSVHFAEISQNKTIMMAIAVVIISIPSLPTFLVLLSISKLNPGKSKDGPILNEKYLRWMICLAVGSLTGDVFFGMMEHIMNASSHGHGHDHHDHDHSHNQGGGHKHEFKLEIFCIIVGIFFFYMVDRIVGGHNHNHGHEIESSNGCEHKHDHTHEEKEVQNSKKEKSLERKEAHQSEVRRRGGNEVKKDSKIEEKVINETEKKTKKSMDRSAILYLVADFLHNVIDGIGIGVAFNINNTLGITTTIAIANHELPHEIGDFAILMKKNYSLGTIMLTQLSTATGALFGGLLGIYFGNFAESYLLGFTAGGFLYLALGNMIPELLHSPKKATIFEALIETTLGFMGAGLIILSS